MEKKLYFLTADLRKTTHRPMIIADFTYEALIKTVPELKESPALKTIYADPAIERIILIVYTDKTGTMKRRIAHSPSGVCVTDKEILTTITMLAAHIGFKMDFHSESEAKKIIPTEKAEREIIAKVRENGTPVDLRDFT